MRKKEGISPREIKDIKIYDNEKFNQGLEKLKLLMSTVRESRKKVLVWYLINPDVKDKDLRKSLDRTFKVYKEVGDKIKINVVLPQGEIIRTSYPKE